VSSGAMISPWHVAAMRRCDSIKVNDYRLAVAVDFEEAIFWIKWIGTHRDYDEIDVTEVEYDG
jgi:mRNA interferase HigB